MEAAKLQVQSKQLLALHCFRKQLPPQLFQSSLRAVHLHNVQLQHDPCRYYLQSRHEAHNLLGVKMLSCIIMACHL